MVARSGQLSLCLVDLGALPCGTPAKRSFPVVEAPLAELAPPRARPDLSILRTVLAAMTETGNVKDVTLSLEAGEAEVAQLQDEAEKRALVLPLLSVSATSTRPAR